MCSVLVQLDAKSSSNYFAKGNIIINGKKLSENTKGN